MTEHPGRIGKVLCSFLAGRGGIRLGASSPLASLTPPATTGEEPAAQLGPGHLWSQKEQEVLGPDHWAPEQ